MKHGVIEGSPAEEHAESAEQERMEMPTEVELDKHHKTLMDAQAIKDNPALMAHLKPHMEKKMKHMKGVMGVKDRKSGGPITSIEGLKAKGKSLA